MRIRQLATPLLLAGLILPGCNMRQDQAGPNSSEEKVSNSAMVEPIDETPRSATPGAPPENSQGGPR